MSFPTAARFGVTLEGSLNGENEFSINFCGKFIFIPISVGVVDVGVSGGGGSWRVGVGIFGIATIDVIIFRRSQGKKGALNGLVNTGGVCRCNLMKSWCGTWRTVTAIT